MHLFKTALLIFAVVISSASSQAQTLDHKKSIVPKIYLEYWNSYDVISENNCYNYSTNRRTDSYAQPGEAAHKKLVSITCQEVYEAASHDQGVTPTSYFPFANKQDDLLIALVVEPGSDFHWYRRDDNNLWTHKPGGTEATDRDEAGDKITDPEKADRGDYSDFCGYFRIQNIVTTKNEQNSGMVVIGNLKKLPAVPVSTIELLKYSGRPNAMADLVDFQTQIESLSKKIEIGLTGKISRPEGDLHEIESLTKPKLGYHGLLIRDEEGLFFPNNITLHIFKGQLTTELKILGYKFVRTYYIPELTQIEDDILAQMK